MKKSQEKLLASILDAANKGSSMKIKEDQREDATALVESGVCYWSMDYDHVSVYDKH